MTKQYVQIILRYVSNYDKKLNQEVLEYSGGILQEEIKKSYLYDMIDSLTKRADINVIEDVKKDDDFIEILKLWFDFADSLNKKGFDKEYVRKFLKYMQFDLNESFKD